jgi:DNA-binding transcriptional LysR family regulator
VHKLEDELGVVLLERSKKGVKPTAAGEHFRKYCEQSLRDWDQVRNELHHLTSEVTGVLRLGVHPSVAIYTLPHFLPRLIEEHPALRVELEHNLSRRLLERIVQQELEVAFVINPEPRPGLVVRPLMDDEVTIFRRSKPVNEGVLIYDSNLSQIQSVRRQLEVQGLRFERTLESSNLEVISHLMLSGVGHAILPKRVVMSLGAGFTESFPKKITPVRDRLALVYRPEFLRTAKGKALNQAVKRWMADA